MKRIIITPCCKYEQMTQAERGEIVRCSICKKPFLEEEEEEEGVNHNG